MFTNEQNEDLSNPTVIEEIERALKQFEQKRATAHYQVIPLVGGQPVETARCAPAIFREDPANPTMPIATVHGGTAELAISAINTLASQTNTWRHTSVSQRSQMLRNLASIIKRDKAFFFALLIREVGKTWSEANIEISECIDFCNYYADQAEKLFTPFRTQAYPEEDSFYYFQPRGVTVVIAPWNFPLAISCGMAVAALVTGNPVVFKPSEQASLIGYELSRRILEAGIPGNVFAFLPGVGEVVGPALVDHPKTSTICFTGSRAVGLSIIRSAATLQPTQTHVKKVIAELSGKNALIVDSSADIPAAAAATLVSSFGLAGQKCSSCSRVLVLKDVYQAFCDQLRTLAPKFQCGDPQDKNSVVSPVVDEEAYRRILSTIAEGKRTLSLLWEGETRAGGYFVSPTIFADVPVSSPLWRQEIFGPVVCVRAVASFSEAVTLANDSDYALSGSVFSNNEEHITYARDHFDAGNLYINRKTTGAVVEKHPFGGFKLSGVGSKAGGPDYLRQFVDPKVVTRALK